MKPFERLVDVVVLVAVAMLTSACTPVTSDDELPGTIAAGRHEEGRSEEVAAPGIVVVAEAARSPDEPRSGRVTEPVIDPPRIAVSVADQLQQYLLDEFRAPGSEAPWYHRIRRVAVGLHTATIHTDLTSDTGDRAAGLAICRAVSSFPFSSQGRGVTSLDIAVLGRGGRLLASESYDPPRPSARTRPGMTPIHAPQHSPPVFQIAPSPEAPPRPGPTGDR